VCVDVCWFVLKKERERKLNVHPQKKICLLHFMLMLPFVNGKRKENVKKYGRCRGERELHTNEKKRKRKYSVVTEFLMQPVLLFIESKISKSKYSIKSIKSVIKNFF
jgi:hypothetical protein